MRGRDTTLAAGLLGLALVLGGALSGPGARACSAVGPDAHVGQVVAVDPREGTFTLRDAETGRPITFRAEPALLRQVAVGREVLVRYRAGTDGRLEAKAVSL